MSEQISPTLFCGMTAEEVMKLKKQNDELIDLLIQAKGQVKEMCDCFNIPYPQVSFDSYDFAINKKVKP